MLPQLLIINLQYFQLIEQYKNQHNIFQKREESEFIGNQALMDIQLQEIAPNFVGLFQNGSQIIHIHKYQDVLYQNNIVDEVFININDLRMFPLGVISIAAKNAKINYQIIKKQSEYFWIILGCIIIFTAIGGGFYWYKRNRYRVVDVNLIDQEEEIQLQ